MLPSSGAFREIDCPYYDAICGRPYCHFRHRSKKKPIHNIESADDSADNSNSSNDVPTYKPTPKSQLASARGHLPISYVPNLVIRSERSSNRPPITIEYKPTPKSILSSTVSVAEYVPSPVSKDKAAELSEISNVVDNIDLEDLDTEFGLIDEILSDGSFVENKTCKEDTKVAETKTEVVPKKSSSDKKPSKSSKKDKEPPSKHKSSSSSKNKRKERDKEKDKDKSSASKDKERDKKTVNKSEKSSKDKLTTKITTSKHKSSSNSSIKNDKKRKSSKDKPKEKSSKSSHSNKSVKSSKSKTPVTISKNTPEENVQILLESHDSNDNDYSNYEPEDLDIDEDDEPTLEEECYKIFNEYKPTPIAELEKAPIIPPPDEKYVPEDISAIGKKRIAYENAEKMTIKKLPPLSERVKLGIPTPAQAMLNRIKQAKLAQSNNEQENIIMELKRQQEELRLKKSALEKAENAAKASKMNERRKEDEIRLKRKRESSIDDTTKLPKVLKTYSRSVLNQTAIKPPTEASNSSSYSQLNGRDLIAKVSKTNEQKEDELRLLKRKRESSIDASKVIKTYSKTVSNPPSAIKPPPEAACNSSSYSHPNGRDLIVASKIKNRIAHQAATTSDTNLIDDILNGRSNPKPRKIAPVLNVTSIQKAKERVDQFKSLSQTARTVAQTTLKAGPRVAHVPDYSLSELPDVTNALRSKLPVNVRTRYLTMFADEAVKLYLSRDDAYNRAVSEEDKCYERCSALATYRNCAMLAINRLRKEAKEREDTGLGPLDGAVDEGVEMDRREGVLGGEKLYGLLQKYRLTDEELELHGYPMASSEPGRAQIKVKPTAIPPLPPNQRICARCKKVYLVDKRGIPQYEEECIYHPLKKRTFRGDRNYLCCKSPDDTGCVTSNTHVSEVSEDRVLNGYQTTLPPSTSFDPRSHSIYALDCEMCYTTIGLELTRVTIVDPQMKTVYESLVKPLNPILDYNTQFSGITHEQMERTSTNILQVQANILHLCNSDTILIGHSLESDLKALKIIHASVLDTSVMFPHKFGLPHKRALRALASDYLQKIIQNSVSGHDSAEDALTCMELVMWKVKEDLKVKGISSGVSALKKR